MIVYRAFNKINGKCYIGKTINSLQQRINSHKSESSLGRYDVAFHRSIRKYGFDAFKWDIICECSTIEDLNEMEIYFISKFNSYCKGYNETLGGDGQSVGYEPKLKTRLKLSKKAKELWRNPIHRDKVSKIHKDKWVRDRAKIVKAQKEWANKPEIRYIKSVNSKNMWKKKEHRDLIRRKLNKTWKIVSTSGEEFIVEDLTLWCKNHNINRSTFYGYNDKDKSWKGYFLKSMEQANDKN